jgi:transposase-like protein
MRGVFCDKTRHYSPEVKWNAVNMKLAGHSKHEIMKVLGIKNDTQIETWVRWCQRGETHRSNSLRNWRVIRS